MRPEDIARLERLHGALGNPLRLVLCRLLVERGELSDDTLRAETSALLDDVRASLEPLVRDGWLVRIGGRADDERDGELGFAIAPGQSNIIAAEIGRAAQPMAAVLDRLRLTDDDPFRHIVGASNALQRVFQQARLAARTNVPVLLTGETGAGKELVAWAIHRASERAARPFASVNAGAIPPGLFESELFGHERGAFTGARRRREGKLVAAHGGTFFLDEIGELPLPSQAKLLRALQEKVVLPVGGTHEVPVDFRLVSATHRDLARMASDGRFRDDLWYRVNVLEIRIPPLRDRPEDIPALVRRFLDLATWRYGVRECPGIEPAALELLQGARWPGNVRELENTVYRAALFSGGQPIDVGHVRRALSVSRATAPGRRREAPAPAARRLEDVVREAVGEALKKNQGNLSAAARQLDISRVTLYRKLREYELLPPSAAKPTGQ